MTLRDISIALRQGTPEWPGDTPYACGWTAQMAHGSSVNLSSITMSPHVGTHADAPVHVHDGWPGAHELPLDAFHGPATVHDVSTRSGELDLDDVPAEIAGGRLILRTGRTIATGEFPDEWPALAESCARELVGRGLRLLAVDAPSVDLRESTGLAVHRTLFAGGAYVLENLDLRRIAPGDYELTAYPLKIMALDAAPVRAVLRELSR